MINRQPIGDDISWFHSGQPDAKQMDGIGGSGNTNNQMLLMLDSVLVYGYNEQTPTTVVASGGTVLFTFGVAHGYLVRQNILISGATDPALNGKHKVVVVSAYTLSINTLGVSSTDGAIKTKIAPLGWESIFGETEPMKRAYRSLNPESTQSVLYLDMTLPTGHGYSSSSPPKRAMVSVCKDMQVIGEQIGSYTDEMNLQVDAQPNGYLFWYQVKSYEKGQSLNTTTSKTKSEWVIVGNGDYFYFMSNWGDYTGNVRFDKKYRDLYVFGDVPSFSGNDDEFNCVIWCSCSRNDLGYTYFVSNGCSIGATPHPTSEPSGGTFFIKDISGVKNLELATMTTSNYGNTLVSGRGGGFLFPNTSTQSLVALPIYIVAGKNDMRAIMPRLLAIPQILGDNKNLFDLLVVDNILTVTLHVGGYPNNSNEQIGYLAFDLGV